MAKKIVLIWDFDGPIGQINATYPYNFNFNLLPQEIKNVQNLLEILDENAIKCCFAITGFSAEDGIFPFNFPELITDISKRGHEIASHSWKHEWVPIHLKDQIEKSLKRSKYILEQRIVDGGKVLGFVPPHNRPMTWFRRGAISLEDRGLFPFFRMGDNSKLLNCLNENGYKWIRVSYTNLFMKLGISKKNITGRVVRKKGMVVFENHYNGFGPKVIDHILNSNHPTYTVSAHPLMLSYKNKEESLENFLNFLKNLKNSKQPIEFVLPSDFVKKESV